MKSSPNELGYEVRNTAVQQKQIGSTDFRIHTWFDHKRNTMVVEVLTAEQLAQRELKDPPLPSR